MHLLILLIILLLLLWWLINRQQGYLFNLLDILSKNFNLIFLHLLILGHKKPIN